jgi:hypothetical protein
MARSYNVLMMGSSAISFTEAGPELTTPALIEAALRERMPGPDWHCQGDLLFPGETMRRRAATLIERHRPDAAVLWLTSIPFAEDFVVYAVRRRLPRLYSLAWKVAEGSKALAGGSLEGALSPRGLVFRAPRAVARRFIGIEPETTLAAAIESTCDTLRDLARYEDLAVVCRLAVTVPIQQGWLAEAERRTDAFNREVSAACDQLRIAHYQARERAAAEGFPYGMAADLVHFNLPSRRYEAGIVAGYVAHALA